MVANNQTEGNPADTGEVDANSQSSQPQSQPSGGNLAETIENLQKKLDAQDGEIRALKSGKDKAVDRAIKENQSTLEKLAKYLNVDESQVREAQRQSVLDELISERMGGNQSGAPIQGRVDAPDNSAGSRTVENFSVADAIAEVESFELSTNDPSFIELLRKNPTKTDVQSYILERKKPQPPPSPAGLTQSAATGATTPKGSALVTDYKKDMLAARGKGNSFGNAIKEKYRAQGVDVDNISFSV